MFSSFRRHIPLSYFYVFSIISSYIIKSVFYISPNSSQHRNINFNIRYRSDLSLPFFHAVDSISINTFLHKKSKQNNRKESGLTTANPAVREHFDKTVTNKISSMRWNPI